MLSCVIFEDEHLLVVNKPPGWNTHAPSPYAGEGIYDWLRHREPRWAKLAIIHRLDKETSGVMVFSKTAAANRALTEQFTNRQVRKRYLLLTERRPTRKDLTVKSCLVRAGERYVSRPLHAGGAAAETRFESFGGHGGCWEVLAEPLTGRTHQIRVHAAEVGMPILGDTLYGKAKARRLCLHALELTLTHPADGKEMTFKAPVDFDEDPGMLLRAAIIEPDLTNAYRLVHHTQEDRTGSYADKLGDYLLYQSERPLTEEQLADLGRRLNGTNAKGVYHKLLTRQTGNLPRLEASPKLVIGEAAPDGFVIRENGLQFELSFSEGYSFGLFLDQRDNRRRLLTGYVAGGFELPASSLVLNLFAYTCGFSVCAAKAGAKTTSIDLSTKYLEWGKRNFELNGLDSAGHDFIYGDAFEWLRRLGKKQRHFEMVLIDPPTFSQSKQTGVFRVERDYPKLIRLALPLLKRGGVLFVSTNAANWKPDDFLVTIEKAIRDSNRKILQQQYFPQPPDFPISREELAYLKTVWLRIG